MTTLFNIDIDQRQDVTSFLHNRVCDHEIYFLEKF